jgi:putative transcriptional regulator
MTFKFLKIEKIYLIFLVYLLVCLALPGEAQNGRLPPAAGRFLVATRKLPDPRFAQSVILLFQYGKEGAAGLILNHPTEVLLGKAFPEILELQKQKDVLFIGGPVSPNQLFMLISGSDPGNEAKRVFENVFISADKTMLQTVAAQIRRKEPARFYAGYAGWGAGQLELEISGRHWNVMPAEIKMTFHEKPSEIWKDLIDRSDLLMTYTPHIIRKFHEPDIPSSLLQLK